MRILHHRRNVDLTGVQCPLPKQHSLNALCHPANNTNCFTAPLARTWTGVSAPVFSLGHRSAFHVFVYFHHCQELTDPPSMFFYTSITVKILPLSACLPGTSLLLLGVLRPKVPLHLDSAIQLPCCNQEKLVRLRLIVAAMSTTTFFSAVVNTNNFLTGPDSRR